MPYTTGILLGQLTKTSGFDGSVLVRIKNRIPENMPQPESVFLEIEGRPVPFILEEFHYEGGEFVRLKFDGYDSAEKISEFRGCSVFLTTGENGGQNEHELDFLNGYKVIDSEGVALGKIEEIIVNPGQFLLSIKTPGQKELLIPFHEDLIISTDKRKRIIKMEIPEGLRDIN